MATTALIVILHDPDILPRLLRAWDKVGVPGITILPSMGGFQAQKQARRGGLGMLINMFTQDEPGQRTLISLIDEPEILERAISEADRVVKGFDSPRSGILFTIPISDVLGLQKWRQAPPKSEDEDQTSKEPSNLLKWFQEDIKETYGKGALGDWSEQRAAMVSDIIQETVIKPIIVRVDTPIDQVLAKLLANSKVTIASVINTEERLMGNIHIRDLAEVMMAPIVPEAFIDIPDEYNKALKFSDPDQELLAADIMTEPIYAMLDAPLEETYTRMKTKTLTGLPVVDQNYHVKGYITLLDVLSTCFTKSE